jgi:hypothetical protein
MDSAFGIKFENFLPNPRSQIFSPTWFFYAFVYSCTFKPVVNFCIMSKVLVRIFFFFVYGYLIVPVTCTKKLACFHWISLEPLLKVNWTYLCESVSGFSILFHRSLHLSLSLYHTVFITTAVSGMIPSISFLFFQNCFSYSKSLDCLYEFFSKFVSAHKIPIGPSLFKPF